MTWFAPMTRRRFAAFRANRRGWWSLWIFLVLFVLALGAEFVANDRPIVVNYKGEYFWPVFKNYPETAFGGTFPTTADFKAPYLKEKIHANGWMLWPPVRFAYDTHDRNLGQAAPAPPSWRHWLGTDDQGRDVVARVLYGFRLSVLFGLVLTAASSAVGVAVGAIQGYFGGWVDLFGQRVMEIWQGLPELFILIILSSIIVPGFWSLLVILALFTWPRLVGVVRAEFLRARNFDYVKAARALGMRNVAIMWKHVLPNAMVATLTFTPFILSGSIVALTALDFLGLGMPPGAPSLGDLLRQGKENLQAPWLAMTSFLVLSVMLSLLVFVGEAVRDAFDPARGGS